MSKPTSYTFPFNESGPRTLTFGQAIMAAQKLSERISGVLGLWRWEEISLRVIRRGASYTTYELIQFGRVVTEIVIQA